MQLPANVTLVDHPLVHHKLSVLRDARTGAKEFRELTSELATMLAYEATRDLRLEAVRVSTPMAETEARALAGRRPAIVPVLRAGLGMVDGVLALLPTATVGHIGLYRDEETLEPHEYYCNLPADVHEREVLIVDPMLATGGSAVAAISFLREHGAAAMSLLCIIAAPEGIEAVSQAAPDVRVYVAAIDDRLNERGYIVPGLGDAGDRLFGTG